MARSAAGRKLTAGASKVFHFGDPGSWHQYFNCSKNPGPPVIPATGLPQLGILDWAPIDVPDTAMADENVASWAINYLAQPRTTPFFMAVGIIRLKRGDWSPWWPLALLMGSFCAVHLVYWTDARMRAPVMPVVVLFAVKGWSRFASHTKENA